MKRLNIKDALFNELSCNPPAWWKSIINDNELSVQIRKENYIDVYYRGGCLISELRFDGKVFAGKINSQYIPFKKNEYIPYQFGPDSVGFGKVEVLGLDNFSASVLSRIKKNISNFYDSSSEKAIQYKFIENDSYFIDSEFAYRYREGERNTIRIDLVRIDSQSKKIVFVEVKTMGDSRLYTDEIIEQLSMYRNFIENKKEELLDYYSKIFEIKRSIGVLPKGLLAESLIGYQVLTKPLLLFGDCKQQWIDEFSPELDKKIADQATGCYYFGKPDYSCQLLKKTKDNRHIFYSS